MALINDIYVFIETESVKRDAKVSEHPVEEGTQLTDHVRRSPISLSLSGEIVGQSYKDTIMALEQIHKNGTLIEYIGVNMLSKAFITSFQTEHSGDIVGGCRFTMEINEIRIAASPYTAGNGNVGTQQIEENTSAAAVTTRTYTVQSGDTLRRIAKAYYGNANQFTKIFEANRDKISNPDRIQIGQVLVIP